ncbi:hypothetical protein Cfla_0924 [Cellulomonas flavigena DSM 20109]|uniref:Lipoprotein n=1 Tax=Cellulomonas flavigena (strain ATCC 482 / DSM 20109 / BCRC 11376 / JCM 18109 / NBRC 3775 / NCIMB 8073 / NRS 134) TaxID=446466 RepID=D5UKL4_CELFN|nr:hypothetical protein [Cellulomonas flavigena]ADG73832.1 hypothetical protein Cfla_0924 [Cellulomonas flavigena DSM 20109]
MRLPRTVLTLTALLLLTACAAGEPGAAPTTSAPAGGTGGGPGGGGEPTAPAEPAAPALPASCAAIELVTGARIASVDLATCLTDYIRAAGSGRFESRLEGQVSDQRWALVDGGLYAVGSRNGEPSVAVTPDTGWLFTDGTWVQADPGGSSEQMRAADGVDGYRTTSEPGMTYAMIAVAPGFTVGERAEVELADGTTTSLWPIRADGPFQPIPAIPATTTELVVWTDVPGPTARLDVTGTAVDGTGQTTTGTSTTFYEDWGQGVDLAEIEELVGVPLPRP